MGALSNLSRATRVVGSTARGIIHVLLSNKAPYRDRDLLICSECRATGVIHNGKLYSTTDDLKCPFFRALDDIQKFRSSIPAARIRRSS